MSINISEQQIRSEQPVGYRIKQRKDRVEKVCIGKPNQFLYPGAEATLITVIIEEGHEARGYLMLPVDAAGIVKPGTDTPIISVVKTAVFISCVDGREVKANSGEIIEIRYGEYTWKMAEVIEGLKKQSEQAGQI